MQTCNYVVVALFGNVMLNFGAIDHIGVFFFSPQTIKQRQTPHTVYSSPRSWTLQFVKSSVISTDISLSTVSGEKSKRALAARQITSVQFRLLPQLRELLNVKLKCKHRVSSVIGVLYPWATDTAGGSWNAWCLWHRAKWGSELRL